MEDPWNDSEFYLDADGIPRRKSDPVGFLIGCLLLLAAVAVIFAALVTAGHYLGGE